MNQKENSETMGQAVLKDDSLNACEETVINAKFNHRKEETT